MNEEKTDEQRKRAMEAEMIAATERTLRPKKVVETIIGARRQAAEMRQAAKPQAGRRTRLRKEAEERDKLKGNQRTYEEIEGELPSIEWLATGFITKSEGDFRTKTRKEILESGTLLEKIRLFYSSTDLKDYFGGENQTLSEVEERKIIESVLAEEGGYELARQCTTEYHTITEYGRELGYYYKRFQSVFGLLAVLLNRWDEYEKTAELLSDIFNYDVSDPIIDYIDADKYPYEPVIIYKDDIDKFYSTDKVRAFLERKAKYSVLDGATLYIDKHDLAFRVKVDGRGGLYSQIKKAAKEVRAALSDFKAYAKVAEEYIDTSTLKYTPIAIMMSLENAEEERYTRYLVKNPIYFRSAINYKKEAGETISPEEERRAVIPDYYEVKPSMQIYRDCKKGIKQMADRNEERNSRY